MTRNRTTTDSPSPAAIRRRRVSMGLTASDLADMAGIGEGEVLMLEMGSLPVIDGGAWDAICTALHLGATCGINPPPPLATGQGARRSRTRGATAPLPRHLDATAPAAPWWVQLRLQRRRLGMTLTEAAKQARVGVRRVVCLEAGSYPATSEALDSYHALACGLALDPPELPILPPVKVSWEGFTVGSRMERSARVSTQLAVTAPPTSPAGLLLLRRLQNGWSRARTAGAIGCSRVEDVEALEVLTAWPMRPPAAMIRLSELWKAHPPFTVGAGVGVRAYLPSATAAIVERTTAQAERWGLDREALCVLCDLSPMSLDALLTRNLSAPDTFWDAVSKLTSCGFDLLSGLTLPPGAHAWEGSGEKDEARRFCESERKTENPIR